MIISEIENRAHNLGGFKNKPQGLCAGIILFMRSANGRRCHNVTSSLIGWAHSQNDTYRLLKTIGWTSIEIRTWINNYWYIKYGVQFFINIIAKPLLDLDPRWVIVSHITQQGPVSLRLMTSQFKDIVTHTPKKKTVKFIFCGVWVQNFVCNFKGALWNFTQNFEPIHRKKCILRGFKNLTTYEILKSWHLKS